MTSNCTNLLMSCFPLLSSTPCRCEEIISPALYLMAHLLVALLSLSIVIYSDDCFFILWSTSSLPSCPIFLFFMPLFFSALQNHFLPPFQFVFLFSSLLIDESLVFPSLKRHPGLSSERKMFLTLLFTCSPLWVWSITSHLPSGWLCSCNFSLTVWSPRCWVPGGDLSSCCQCRPENLARLTLWRVMQTFFWVLLF